VFGIALLATHVPARARRDTERRELRSGTIGFAVRAENEFVTSLGALGDEKIAARSPRLWARMGSRSGHGEQIARRRRRRRAQRLRNRIVGIAAWLDASREG
jgi:hypothetical protein